MQRDIRQGALYAEAEALYGTLRRPGTGQICDATDVHASADGRHAVFAGTVVERLEGALPTRICWTDLTTGETRVLTSGPNVDRLPRYSPDGRQIAFLSDRHRAGDFQLYLLDLERSAVTAAPIVEGWIEYLHWSPDGRRVLLGVAGHGADVAGGQGAVTSQQASTKTPSWTPEIETSDETYRWRRAWVFELATREVHQVSRNDCNVWEATWCGNDALAAVVSPGPGEGSWYTAQLHQIALVTGSQRPLYVPQSPYQLGWPSSSPSGRHVAFVEAICSDRWFVAGNLLVIDTQSGEIRRVETSRIDITYTEWRSDRNLLLAGHRAFEIAVATYDVLGSSFLEQWSSNEITAGYFSATVSGFGETGNCLLIGESFERASEIAVLRGRDYRAVKSFDLTNDRSKAIAEVERLTWKAPDGLEIQGWLLLPHARPPHPVVMVIHGGPVTHWRPRWLVRGNVFAWMLLKRGYAVFYPNPRGSSGRGQEFIRQVVGDMGGADAYDCLSGIDYLLARGIADPQRLGVIGGSYGGFMTSWLITQDARFAAAVPGWPVTNQVTEHLLSNIPNFVAEYLADSYTHAGGKYFQRSPVMQAHRVKTPTMIVCGTLDRCTRPEEAIQFHQALLENGVESVLVTYPEEGHGVRNFPAAIDYTARLVDWFETHLRTKAAQ